MRLVLLAFMPGLALPQVVQPHIFYSDLQSGPNTGGQNNAGVFVTIYGIRFGASQGSSYVTIGSGRAAAYPIWSDGKITFQLGSAASTGNISVTTSNGTSNTVPFTVRSGNIYFVSTSGNDSNAGSYTAPWATVLKARGAMVAGDTTYLENGVAQTSDDGSNWSTCMLLGPEIPTAAGTAAAPIAMVAYPGATATIGNVNGPDSGIRTDTGASYWVFAGLVLRGQNEAITPYGDTGWRIVGNDMSCPNGNGATGCFEANLFDNAVFYGNNVHDTGVSNASAEYQGVYFSTDSNNLDIGWNTIANVHGCRGIQINSSPLSSTTGYNQYNIIIHDNIIHDTQCDGIVLASVDPSKGPVEVYNNIIYNAGEGPANPEGTGNWSCVYVAGYTNTGSPGGGAVQVFANTMYNCGSFSSPPWGDANFAVGNGGNNPNLTINVQNNIMYQEGSVPYLVGSVSGSNNLFYGAGAAPSGVTASVSSDPLFVDLAEYNFHLESSSPAACAGTTTSQTADFDGVPLPQCSAYPIGAYAYATGSGSDPTVSVSVSPATVSLPAGGSQQFTATVTGSTNTAVTWSMNPVYGTLSSAGLYTAPSGATAQEVVTVTATSAADSTKSASATVTVAPAAVSVSVSPASVNLNASQSQQFTATVSNTTNTAVTWSISPSMGTISAAGMYSAPSTCTAQQTVTVTATSSASTTKSATATVTLMPTAAVSVSISPASVSLSASKSQQLTATVSNSTNTAVTWSISPSVGTISTAGLYTAPSSITTQQTVTVTATSSASTTKSATATVTLVPTAVMTVSVSPASVSLNASQSQQFTATCTNTSNTAVTWSVSPSVGTISASGKYSAPSSVTAQQAVTVTATSSANAAMSAKAAVTLMPAAAVSVGVSPASVSLSSTQSQQFTATVSNTTTTAVTWSINPAVGTISTAGLYTAPSSVTTQQTVKVTATSSADKSKSASATITLTTAPAPNPLLTLTLVGSTIQVTWKAPPGSSKNDWMALSAFDAPYWWTISSRNTNGATSGRFTVPAPATPGIYEFRYYYADTWTILTRSIPLPIGVAQFKVSTSATTVAPGGQLTVTWSVPNGKQAVEAALFAHGQTNDQEPFWWNLTHGLATGSYTITAPTKAGQYEFRLMTGNYVDGAITAPITVQ